MFDIQSATSSAFVSTIKLYRLAEMTGSDAIVTLWNNYVSESESSSKAVCDDLRRKEVISKTASNIKIVKDLLVIEKSKSEKAGDPVELLASLSKVLKEKENLQLQNSKKDELKEKLMQLSMEQSKVLEDVKVMNKEKEEWKKFRIELMRSEREKVEVAGLKN
jgi:hypothetical protein